MRKPLTYNSAIRECKKLWAEIKASGLSKDDFWVTPQGKKWQKKGHVSDCPLCAFASQRENPRKTPCTIKCSLGQQYKKTCFGLGFTENGRSPQFFQAVEGLKEKSRQWKTKSV